MDAHKPSSVLTPSVYLWKERESVHRGDGEFIFAYKGHVKTQSIFPSWVSPSPPAQCVGDSRCVFTVLPKGTALRTEGSELGWATQLLNYTVLVCWSSEGKWRASPDYQEDDVTAPELVITGENGGVEGHPGVASVWLQSVHIMLKSAPGVVGEQFLMLEKWQKKMLVFFWRAALNVHTVKIWDIKLVSPNVCSMTVHLNVFSSTHGVYLQWRTLVNGCF